MSCNKGITVNNPQVGVKFVAYVILMELYVSPNIEKKGDCVIKRRTLLLSCSVQEYYWKNDLKISVHVAIEWRNPCAIIGVPTSP